MSSHEKLYSVIRACLRSSQDISTLLAFGKQKDLLVSQRSYLPEGNSRSVLERAYLSILQSERRLVDTQSVGNNAKHFVSNLFRGRHDGAKIHVVKLIGVHAGMPQERRHERVQLGMDRHLLGRNGEHVGDHLCGRRRVALP